MASKLQLRNPMDGMHFIWNVSQHVGDNISCQNQPTDVNLVKILIAEIMRVQPPAWVNRSLRIPFEMNGQMDFATAYWIRLFCDRNESHLPYEQKGIISPARSASYGRDYWIIVKLNELLRRTAPNIWSNLPDRPNGSPQLRSELQ